ncbi:hypothetical protein [Nonomuraea sp. NPDC052265]|uniref:hypothetical protein n=1 Tax=Nonomuraea sp. NPDC052265 TaxID=3364374 RepID=UPI0037C79B33
MAWEGARTFVSAATTDACRWLGAALGHHLGNTCRPRLRETRLRLRAATDAAHAGTASRLPRPRPRRSACPDR